MNVRVSLAVILFPFLGLSGCDNTQTLNFAGGFCTYTGGVEDGLPNGQGTSECKNGERYVGEWRQGLMWGKGEHFLPNSGTTYTGEFESNQRHGLGALTERDGTKFNGTWESDLATQGAILYPDGSKWEGKVFGKTPQRGGKGILTRKDGWTFDGEIFDNRSAKGVLTESDGWKWTGTFDWQWRPNGEGISRTSPDGVTIIGSCYEGAFRFEEIALVADKAGNKWVGRLSEKFLPNGFGVGSQKDGTVFIGNVLANEQHGRGIVFNPDGTVRRAGWWCNDAESDSPCEGMAAAPVENPSWSRAEAQAEQDEWAFQRIRQFKDCVSGRNIDAAAWKECEARS